MLINKLNEIISILNVLIEITDKDIKNIKEAKHDEIFKNMNFKENLAQKFYNLKNEIDLILVQRNKPIEEIFSPEEEKLFDEFRGKLNLFYDKHKHFSRLAITVANFYNALNAKIKDEKPISYNESATFDSKLKLKA
ncbi:hypothetical protein [Caminibacter sp.]